MGREDIARAYLRGRGIALGALQKPLPVPPEVEVRYVDRHPVEVLRTHYPELKEAPLVDVDVIDDGQTLSTFGEASQDFVIANHFVEHIPDPIGAIENMLRVLRPGGLLYLAVPDKRRTFDRERPVTTVDHLLEVYTTGEDPLRRIHFEEWVRHVDRITDPEEYEERVEYLLDIDYSIHHHVWRPADFLHFAVRLADIIRHPHEIELFIQNREDQETIVILGRS